MRRVIALLALLSVFVPARAYGVVAGSDFDGDSGSIFAGVGGRPVASAGGGASHGSSAASSAAGASGGGASNGGGGRPAGPARQPGRTDRECTGCRPPTPVNCLAPLGGCTAAPTSEAPAAAAGTPAPVVDPGTVAASVRESMPVEMPAASTSPPADGFQLTGLHTWFWLDADGWTPTSVRAEVPGAWIEVTATPTEARWDPGDGTATVTCAGPGRRHPGTPGATTDCGHTYTRVGRHEIAIDVSYAVTWTASTGEAGTVAPLVLTSTLPIDVQQRQAVTD